MKILEYPWKKKAKKYIFIKLIIKLFNQVQKKNKKIKK